MSEQRPKKPSTPSALDALVSFGSDASHSDAPSKDATARLNKLLDSLKKLNERMDKLLRQG